MKIWKIVEERWCQPIIKALEDPEYRKKLEEERKKEEEERRKIQEEKEKIEEALKSM
jgi:acyl-CoA hydrolase